MYHEDDGVVGHAGQQASIATMAGPKNCAANRKCCIPAFHLMADGLHKKVKRVSCATQPTSADGSCRAAGVGGCWRAPL